MCQHNWLQGHIGYRESIISEWFREEGISRLSTLKKKNPILTSVEQNRIKLSGIGKFSLHQVGCSSSLKLRRFLGL